MMTRCRSAWSAIDPLVAMAHECHSVDARRRAAIALDCLMAYESFERDWHLEKLRINRSSTA